MIAQTLVENGARVYIASRSAETLRRASERLTAAGPGTCIPLPQDLSDEAGCAAAAAALREREPSLKILVNNSGISWGQPFESFPEKVSGWSGVPGRRATSKRTGCSYARVRLRPSCPCSNGSACWRST